MGVIGNNRKTPIEALQYAMKTGATDREVQNCLQAVIEEKMQERNFTKNYMTAESREYYGEVAKAMRAKQALPAGLELPECESVELTEKVQTTSPLLEAMDKLAIKDGVVNIIRNANEATLATFGPLTSAIVKEVEAKVKTTKVPLIKLSAFGMIANDLARVDVKYLKTYLMDLLKEAEVKALENEIVNGDGTEDHFHGLLYDLAGEAREAVAVTDLKPATILPVIKEVLTTDNGRAKKLTQVVAIMNPDVYFEKYIPAVKVLGGAGYADAVAYDILPVVVDAVPKDKIIIGDPKAMELIYNTRQEMALSTDFKFLEDISCIRSISLVNFVQKDNSARVLDVSELAPIMQTVQVEGIVATKEQGVAQQQQQQQQQGNTGDKQIEPDIDEETNIAP